MGAMLSVDNVSGHFHMANPNPQGHDKGKFYGVRDTGYKSFYENKDPLAEVIRFGKKVNYDKAETSNELLKFHLGQMRDKMSRTLNQKHLKRSEERDFLKKMDTMNQMQDFRNEFSKITMKDNMQDFNENMIK